jgi:hypothetical protein
MPFVVTKTLPDMDGAPAIVGTFSSPGLARKACIGAGVYIIANTELDRVYKSGTLLDCERIVVVGTRTVGTK